MIERTGCVFMHRKSDADAYVALNAATGALAILDPPTAALVRTQAFQSAGMAGTEIAALFTATTHLQPTPPVPLD